MNLPKNIRSDVADRTVRIVAPAMIVSMLVMMLTILLDSEKQYQRLIPALILIITMIPPWILAVKGKPIAGAIIVIFNFCLGILSGMIFSGGVQAPAYIGILVLITITIVLFGTRGGIIFAVLSLSLGGLFLWFDVNGMLHHVDPPSPVFILVLLAVFLAMQFFYVLIPVRLMDKALSESQEKGIKLQHTITELKKSEKQFRDLFNSISDLIYTQDMEGYFITVNSAMKQLFGYELEEFIGHRASEFMEPEVQSGFASRYLGVIKKQGHHGGIACYFKKNKKEIYIEYQSSLVKPDDAEPYISGIGRDVTEKILSEEKVKKLQEQVTQAQKMESIGTLAGGIAHDFNNLLGIIVGNTELALDDVPEWNPAHTNLEEIKIASLRATNIVRQLLSFSRKTEQKLQPIEIAMVIKDSLKFLRSTIPTTINIEQDIQITNETILADPTQINQIIMNLCINASHAMEQTGGDLTVTVAKVILDDNSAKDYPDLKSGDHVKIMVSDTGPGIDPKIIDQIFDPYFTTKEVGKGSGMGLAVVQGIVKNHNGTITVDSRQGKGSKFIILFPLTSGKPIAETQTTQDIPRGNETILFVDDEISITKMVKRMFERLGYKVETATTPQDALERFSLNPDHFDLVITDMTMPQMTGVKLSEKLMDIRKDIPIIVCTGHSALVDEKKAKELGLAAYIMKPIDMQETAQTIRKILDKK